MYAIIEWLNPYRGGNDFTWIMNRDEVSDKDFRVGCQQRYKRGPNKFIDWIGDNKPIKYFREDQKEKFATVYKKSTGINPKLD